MKEIAGLIQLRLFLDLSGWPFRRDYFLDLSILSYRRDYLLDLSSWPSRRY